MTGFASTSWDDIEALRTELSAAADPSVEAAAQRLATALHERLEGVVLARVFAVVPYAALPDDDAVFARELVGDDPRLVASTRVLSLVGTRGRLPAWDRRERSEGHRAIPLLDRSFVGGIPMIAKLLADLEVDLAALDEGRPIATRRMLGGRNATFFVPDAPAAVDASGRPIIAATGFVARHGVRTVFGMGGAWFDGTLAVVVLFCDRVVERPDAERFASFVGTFKTLTTKLVQAGALYDPPVAEPS